MLQALRGYAFTRSQLLTRSPGPSIAVRVASASVKKCILLQHNCHGCRQNFLKGGFSSSPLRRGPGVWGHAPRILEAFLAQRCRKVMKIKWGGNIFLLRFSVVWGHSPQNFFCCFRALRQLLVQSEAKILIELLNICG